VHNGSSFGTGNISISYFINTPKVMPKNTKQLYAQYTTLLQKAADINYASAVLGWDQEVYMPPKGAAYRGRQLATLASQAHELLTGNRLGNLLQELSAADGLTETEKSNVRLSLEDYQKNKKLSPEFVEELSKQTSICFNAWIEARQKNDYGVFAPSLARMIDLKKQQAEMYGYQAHPYDALLDEYEKDATVAMLEPVFQGIREQLPLLLNKIRMEPQVSNDCFHQHFPKEQQWDFGICVLKHMGFDFKAGRQDYSEHPFTTSFAATDVRITTRVDERNFASMLWSCIHEGGHALYEQGLPEEEYGLPLGSAASLGIHESQSRFWENCIGRGIDFWTFFYPLLQQYFPQQLNNISLDTFYKAANRVAPSLIRTEADEVTYHFHVMIRYEIEKGLIAGALNTKDIPAKWNELYDKYLGVTPKDDKTGVLQDVHWSHGSFGYFPTYTLGSFYAAQFFARAGKDIMGLSSKITNGELTALLPWLREKIHRHGRRYTSEELCERVTGEKLNTAFFMQYIENKYAGVYGFVKK
jgi:carboxypeptidase Taq